MGKLNYCHLLKNVNQMLDGAEEFYLYPGMEFFSEVKWWPDIGVRPTLHEGIDFCYWADCSGVEMVFTPEISIPVMDAGKIIAICQDYLGHTVFVDHLHDSAQRFLSIYAHIQPVAELQAGKNVQKGDVLGYVADTTGRKNRMPAHLHFSIMQVDRDIPAADFTWDLICNSKRGSLLDPLSVIDETMIKMVVHNHWKERAMKETR